MDFEAVPAGTGPVAALPLRGPDHNIEYLQSDAFHRVLGDATRSVAAVAANTRSSPYSSAGDPDMLACHALLNAMSSRTKSPELPSVLYEDCNHKRSSWYTWQATPTLPLRRVFRICTSTNNSTVSLYDVDLCMAE